MGKNTTQLQQTQTKLLPYLEEAEKIENPVIKMFFDGPERKWVHSVPRLHLFFEGETSYSSYKNGDYQIERFKENTLVYSAFSAWLQGYHSPAHGRILSFSFFPNYIRVMHLDRLSSYVGNNIFFHTNHPLTPAGKLLIQTIDALHGEGQDDLARTLLLPLLQISINCTKESLVLDMHHNVNLWQRICQYMRENWDKAFTREDVAQYFQITPGYVSILFNRYSEKGFAEMRLWQQLEHARMLLQNSHLRIEDIATQSGFNSANYFIRSFKKEYKVTPAFYREQGEVVKE